MEAVLGALEQLSEGDGRLLADAIKIEMCIYNEDEMEAYERVWNRDAHEAVPWSTAAKAKSDKKQQGGQKEEGPKEWKEETPSCTFDYRGHPFCEQCGKVSAQKREAVLYYFCDKVCRMEHQRASLQDDRTGRTVSGGQTGRHSRQGDCTGRTASGSQPSRYNQEAGRREPGRREDHTGCTTSGRRSSQSWATDDSPDRNRHDNSLKWQDRDGRGNGKGGQRWRDNERGKGKAEGKSKRGDPASKGGSKGLSKDRNDYRKKPKCGSLD